MTQKELSEKIGLTDQHRIVQYEKGVRVPKKDLVDKMALALDVNPYTLYDTAEHDASEMMELLFWLDELKSGEITRDEYFEWKINWPYTCDDCEKFEPKKQWRSAKSELSET